MTKFTASQFLRAIVAPACDLMEEVLHLPCDRRARVLLLAIAAQESGLEHRAQMQGTARSYWQEESIFMREVLENRHTADWIRQWCKLLDIEPKTGNLYAAALDCDLLACGIARMGLYLHPADLPSPIDQTAGWQYYLDTWRPGKPRPDDWPANHRAAIAAVLGG